MNSSVLAHCLAIIGLVSLVPLLAAATAAAALPRTYQVQRVDNPTPASDERFGDGLVNGGDLNGDGEDDLVVGIDEHGTIKGELHVFSGATGARIRTIPAPDPDAGGPGDSVDAFGTYVGKIADVGRCATSPAPAPGANCPAGSATGDGIPDILASAIGADVDVNGDDQGIDYVIDGATGTVLKRIVMPAVDRTAQAANSPTASQGAAFGRTILSPAGLPPCAGNAGIGACPPMGAPTFAEPYAEPAAVRIGNVSGDAGNVADIVIGASDFTEAPASNPLCSTGTCFQTGRFYVYAGENLDIAGGPSLAAAEDTPLYTLKNPMVQTDDATTNSRFHREAMGYSVAPVGDLGKCNNTTPIAPGDNPSTYYCLNTANNTTTPDGKADFIASSHRVDTNGMGDVGVAFAIDGATGRVMDIYNHPEPQISSIFGFSNYNQPAMGDLGSSTAPDVYQGAMIHNVQSRAQGRGWVLSGDFRSGGANHYNIAVLDDPTPSQIGNFSTSSAGVGDVSGDARKELMIGAYGPHAPQVVDDVINDVHIFSALGEQVLQTIPDPDQQPGSGFGRALAPMGDLNNDGFLDYAVGAGGFDPGASVTCSPCQSGASAAQGRIYILRSDNSPAPPGVSPPPPPGVSPPPPIGVPPPVSQNGTVPVLAGRTITLAPSATKVSRPRSGKPRAVKLDGVVEAFSNRQGCEPGQTVALQRRRPGSARYGTFASRRTNARGEFSAKFTPRATYFYRARVGQSQTCLGAVSERERIDVVAPKKSKRRR
ncbi:MAG: integrin alpha [Solirubrobacteraceae bacterium]